MANYFRAPGGGSNLQNKQQRKEARTNFNTSTGYFGAPLDHECPIIMCDCMAFLRNRGFYEVGVFRVPGNQDVVNELKRLYDERYATKKLKESRGDSILNSFQPMPSVNDVASLMKLFFTELPDPLIHAEVTDALMEVSAKRMTEDKETVYFSKIIGRMRSPNRECLGFLISFLRELCAFRRFNNMSANNLATCFVLSAMGRADAQRQMLLVTKGSVILRKLIDQEVKIMMPSMNSVKSNTHYMDDTQIVDGKKIALPPPVIPTYPPVYDDDFDDTTVAPKPNTSKTVKGAPPAIPGKRPKPQAQTSDPFPENYLDKRNQKLDNVDKRGKVPKPPATLPGRYAGMNEAQYISPKVPSSNVNGYYGGDVDTLFGDHPKQQSFGNAQNGRNNV